MAFSTLRVGFGRAGPFASLRIRTRHQKEGAMPDDQNVIPELKLEQIIFVSKYLKVRPRASWYPFSRPKPETIRRVEDANQTVKRNFGEFQRARDSVTGMVADMEREAEALDARYAAAADADPANENAVFADAMTAYREKLAELTAQVRATVKKVDEAAKDAPKFGEGKTELDGHEQELDELRAHLPALPRVVVRTVLSSLLAIADRVKDRKAFVGVGGMTREMAAKLLEDDGAETRRALALQAYDQVCETAAAAIDEIVKEVRNGTQRTDGQLCDAAEALAAAVLEDCEAPLAELRAVLNEQALALMDALKGDGSGIAGTAGREAYRMEQIRDRTGKLDTAIGTLEGRLEELLHKQAVATGFNQKREIAAQYKAEKARLDELKTRRAQFQLYQDAFAGRMARLQKAEDDFNIAVDIGTSPKNFINARRPLPPATAATKEFLLGSGDQTGPAMGQVLEWRMRFQRASTTVLPQDQLFMGEPPVTDISEQQFLALDKILDRVTQLAELGELPAAQALMSEAISLFMRFQASTKFMLPDLPEAPPSPLDRTEQDLKRLSVQLDRFWGRGGDEDDALRQRLAEIVEARDEAMGQVPIDLTDVETDIATFRKDLDAAEQNFVANPQDEDAREAAKDKGNQIRKDLLNLFQTRPVDEANVAKVELRRLLVIDNGDGTRSYHEIQTEKGGTLPKRKNSHVPLETMEMMLEKARMLDALAECESPGCREMIDAAVMNAEDDLTAIRAGDKAYDHIAIQIRKCDTLLGDQLLKDWLPTGFGDTKVRYEAFKKDYVRTMRADVASTEIDDLHGALTAHRDAAKQLFKDYKATAAKLDKLAGDLDSKKARSGTVGKLLERLISAGPQGVIGQFDTKDLDGADLTEANRLIAVVQTDLTALKKKVGDIPGFEGKLAGRLSLARQMLETKTTSGIETAGTEADKIADDAKTKATELAALDIRANGLADFSKLAEFIVDAAGGMRTKGDLMDAADKERKELKKELDAAKAFLKKHRKTMVSYADYKTVCDMIEKQYDAIGRTYDKTGDADLALSQFQQQKRSAKELNTEMAGAKGIPPAAKGKVSTEFIPKLADELARCLGLLQENAAGLGEAIREEFKNDKGRMGNADLKRNVTTVKEILDLTTRAEVTALGVVQPEVRTDIDTALALDPTDPRRRAAVATAREAALAHVRDIRARLDADPALKVYRDNPFDKGASWPTVVSALHQLETRLIRDLDPAKV